MFESLKKEIVLEGVSVSFGDKKVLNGIDITFPSKKITVVMGESGVGKTTIFNILTGLIEPTRGRAAIDGNDLRDYAINSYRKKIGLVSQDGIVFPGNLRENLLLRNENATDEKMVEFIELFGLNSLFPDGVPDLDFRIEENNTNLSGGQRQRIAMIRELLVSPEILLMDEPTSALDEKTQSIVIDFINKKKGKMTVIIITHQKELLKLADVVYEIEEKRINLLK
jgi:ABC-type bacteriocin/lantibiotic exporter with double-glycine peptidase domain